MMPANLSKADDLLINGVKHLFKEDYGKAIQKLTEAVNLAKSEGRKEFLSVCLAQLSFAFSEEKRYFEALNNALAAIELNPNNTLAYQRLGKAYVGFGKFGDAEKAYLKVLERGANDTVESALYNCRVEALKRMGADEDIAKRALQLGGPNCMLELAKKICFGDPDPKALEDLDDELYQSDDDSYAEAEREWKAKRNYNSHQSAPKQGGDVKEAEEKKDERKCDEKLLFRCEEKPKERTDFCESKDETDLHDAATLVAASNIQNRQRRVESALARGIEKRDPNPADYPTNIHGCKGIWIERITRNFNRQWAKEIFCHYGTIINTVFDKKYFALWVTYDNEESPIHAIAHLEGCENKFIAAEIDGKIKPLRIRFHAGVYGIDSEWIRLSPEKAEEYGECFDWRTVGCSDPGCKLKHYAANEGVDAQAHHHVTLQREFMPWQVNQKKIAGRQEVERCFEPKLTNLILKGEEEDGWS